MLTSEDNKSVVSLTPRALMDRARFAQPTHPVIRLRPLPLLRPLLLLPRPLTILEVRPLRQLDGLLPLQGQQLEAAAVVPREHLTEAAAPRKNKRS